MPRKSPPVTGAIVSAEHAAKLQAEQSANVMVDWGGKRPWFPWQLRLLNSTVDEIGLFGGKSGGKSSAMRGWLVGGNPNLPDFDADGQPLVVNQSYINHPDYYGLILRRNEKDLKFFLREAERMWAPLGMVYKNGYFESPVGARIDCGHLSDESAWQRYIGNEYQKVAIDEAGLIPEYGMIEELRSCMRTPHPDMRIQIVYASNAGGPGTGWIIDRFMKVLDAEGNPIPHDTVIKEERIHPISGKKETKTRIWMFSNVQDNFVMRDTEYATDLFYLQDKKRQSAYYHGLWDALYGSYFGDVFRPDGPAPANNEPANANHVIAAKDLDLKPWWHRSISMDWGYAHDAAILWACQSPDGRVYVYRELSVAKTSPELLGYEIAMRSRDELRNSSSKSMTLHLSHDAFHNDRGERSIAELIGAGIARVLGPQAVHLPDVAIQRMKETWAMEPYRYDQDVARQKAIDEIKLQRKLGITIRMAQKTGPIGWMYCRELMRWQQIGTRNAEYDPALASRLFNEDQRAFREYSRSFRELKPEILPKLQIVREGCPKLISSIPKAQHEDGTENVDKKHFSGKDLCFVAGTMVATSRGQVPIEEVLIGDGAWTRAGFRRVLMSDLTNLNAHTLTVSFSNGSKLTGTPNHPIFRSDGTCVRMDLLRPGDAVWSSSLLNLRENVSGDIQNRHGDTCELISGTTPDTLFTEPFGKALMAQFLQSITSIIKTETRSITPLTTLSAFLAEFMPDFMPPLRLAGNGLEIGSPLFGHLPKLGMAQRKAVSGIEKTEKMHGLIACSMSELALCAGDLLSLPLCGRSFAQIIVEPKIEGALERTTKSVSAWFVAQALRVVAMLRKRCAPVCVVDCLPANDSKVYNLQIEGQQEYFANGILVHNCDSFHYLVMGLRDEHPPEPFEAFQERQMQEILTQNPALTFNDKVHINVALEADWKQKTKSPAPYTPPRHARAGRLLAKGLIQGPNTLRFRL